MPSAKKTIDASGKHILPGLIDPHCHYGFPGSFRSHLTTDTQASAAGGVTTFGHFLWSQTRSALELLDLHKSTLEKDSLIDGFFHIIVVGEFLDDIPKLPARGVNSFKFMLGYRGVGGTKGGLPSGAPVGTIDDGVVFDGFEKISKLSPTAWAMVHCENIEIAMKLRAKLEKAGRQDFPAWEESRPRVAEAEAMRRVIYLAKITGCPLYIVHMTVGEGVDLIAQARAEGINVVAETCPQYLTHSSEDPAPMFAKQPTLGVVNPPLRDKYSIERLWQGIRDGWVSTLASDFATMTVKAKGNDIWNTTSGIGSLSEMILPVMLSEGVNKGRISLEKVTEVCSYNAARIFGRFPQKGTIAVGSDADFVIVDLKKKVKVTPELLHTPPDVCDYTIYDGWEFVGWPVCTILRGNVIVEDGKIIGTPGNAKWIPS